MKFSELIDSYKNNRYLKGRLSKDITLSTGQTLYRGTQSQLLTKMDNGLYKFESAQGVCHVATHEFNFII